MKKVLFNCLALVQSSGGYRSYCINMVNRLIKHSKYFDLEFKLLINPSSLRYFDYEIPRENILQINSDLKGIKRVLWEMIFIPNICRKNNIDILFTPYQIGPVSIKSVKSILMFRNMEPYIAQKYEYPIKKRYRSAILRIMAKYFLQKANKIIAVSEFTQSFLVEELNIDNDKIEVIYHGINLVSATNGRTSSTLFDSNSYIFSAGSFYPFRRLEDIIDAYEGFISKTNADVKLVIAGDGDDKKYSFKIKLKIQRSPYQSNIILLGNVSKEKMESLYNNSLMFIMSSEIEACPNIALESMNTNCSVISTNNPPMPEFFKNCAIYYNYRDTNKLAENIQLLFTNKTLRNKLSNASSIRSKDFSWDITANKTLQLLNSVK